MAINERATVDLSVNGKKAQQELEGLRKKAQDLRRQLDAATQAGDTKGIKRITSALNQTEREMRKVERAAFDVNKVINNLSGASINDINRAIRQMTRQMNALPRGTAEWKRYRTEIERCRAELRNLNTEGRQAEGWLSRANGAFNKWGAGITAAIAAVTGLTLTINKMRDIAKEKEDAQAQLQALTGLDDDSIAWLTEQAEQLSTSMTEGGLRIRQSATEILQAYQLVGGAKPELLENKEALNQVTVETMRLATASGMDLRQAVDGVTLAMNQYGAAADEVSRYVNTLAAGAKFGSAEVDSVTQAVRRAGVAASAADIPIESLVGAIEMLAERGIKDEVAGTGLRSFFIKLEAMAEDTRPSVVGLQTALDNLRAKGLDATDIQKMFGLETYTVAQAMIDGADKVRYYTEAVTGTTAAVEQAAVNSDTAAARAAQASNKMRELGAELGTRLTPLITAGAQAATVMMQALIGLVDIIARNRSVVIALAAAMAGFIVQAKLRVAWSKMLVAAANAEIAATTGLGKAVGLLRGGFQRLFAVIIKNPLGLIAGAASLLIGKFIELRDRARETREEYEKIVQAAANARAAAENDAAEQQRQLRSLYAIARNTLLPYSQRAEALQQLHKLSGRYLGDLKLETIASKEAADAVRDYNDLLAAQSGKEAYAAERNKQLDILQERINQYWPEISKQGVHRLSAQQLVNAQTSDPETYRRYTDSTGLQTNIDAINELTRALDAYDATITRLQAKYPAKVIEDTVIIDDKGKGNANAATTTTADPMAEYKQRAKDIEARRDAELTAEKLAYERGEKALAEHEQAMLEIQIRAARARQDILLETAPGETAEYDRIELELQQLINRLPAAAAGDGDDGTRRTADEALRILDDAYARDLLTYTEYERAKAATARLYAEQAAADRTAAEKEAADWIANYVKQTADEWRDEQLAKAEDYAARGLITARQAAEARAEIEKEYRQRQQQDNAEGDESSVKSLADKVGKAWQAVSPLFQASSQLVQANLAAEEAAINRRYNKEIEAAEGNDERIKQLEEARDAELAKARTEANKKAMAIQIAQAMATTAVGILNAWASSMQMGPILGPIYGAAMTALMVAQAAIQIAAIKKQQQAQAAGYYTGGYTTRAADDRREAGVVHANEFVATAAAVRNPAVRPMLDLIDRAQRNNTVAAITRADIAAAAGARTAPAAAIPAPAATTATAQQPTAGTDPATAKIIDTLRRIDRRMDRPLAAYTYVTGKGGSQEAQRMADAMRANARRTKR